MCVGCTSGQELLIIIPAAGAAASRVRRAVVSRLGRGDETPAASSGARDLAGAPTEREAVAVPAS